MEVKVDMKKKEQEQILPLTDTRLIIKRFLSICYFFIGRAKVELSGYSGSNFHNIDFNTLRKEMF